VLILTVVMTLVLASGLDVRENLTLYKFFAVGVKLNFILAFFNLLPIPPLDGSRVLGGILPRRYVRHLAFLEQYGFIILLVLFISGGFSLLLWPVSKLADLIILLPLRLAA